MRHRLTNQTLRNFKRGPTHVAALSKSKDTTMVRTHHMCTYQHPLPITSHANDVTKLPLPITPNVNEDKRLPESIYD